MTEVEQENVFRIPTENLGELQDRIKKLNKRAAKLGTAPITVSVLRTEIVTERVPAWTLENGEVLEWTTKAREWSFVQIDGETPMLNGWQFIATLVHGENGTIINRVPTFDTEVDLTVYRDADPSHCDHCGLDRRRNDTFVVYNVETGETKQIGRQCLKDFLGYNDPMAVARQLERIREIFLALTNEEDEKLYVTGTYLFPIVSYLAHVACVIRENGWLPASAAGFDETPTSAQAWFNMMDYGKLDKQGRKLYYELTDEDTTLAQAAYAWNELHWSRDGNEFEGNMAVAFASSYFNPRVKGFVAYGVQAYMKDRGEQIEREKKAAQAPSEWQGTVGQREVFSGLTVSDERTISDKWQERTSYLYTMVDDQGNIFKWFASNPVLEVGTTYELKATVKKHDEWKGQKQTMITRAKVV